MGCPLLKHFYLQACILLYVTNYLFIYCSILGYSSLYRVLCVFSSPWQRAPVYWHQQQRCFRQSRSELWRLNKRESAPWFASDHVWPSWGDWQDLFTGGDSQIERRKEGEPEGEQSLNGTGSFYTWPVFLSIFVFVYLGLISLSETGYLLLYAYFPLF